MRNPSRCRVISLVVYVIFGWTTLTPRLISSSKLEHRVVDVQQYKSFSLED